MNREEPQEGEIWKHFKGEIYEIICIGHHSETKERMVVYVHLTATPVKKFWGPLKYIKNELLPDAEPCIRPLSMFMSEVDREKYPDVKQKFRFEKLEGVEA